VTTLRAWLHETDFATPAILELADSFSRSWQEQLNDAGSGQLDVDLEDVVAADCTRDRIVRFDLDDAPVFAILIESLVRRSITQDEEVGQRLELAGRGTLAVLERMVVYPEAALGWEPSADERYFNFSSSDLYDALWDPVVVTLDDSTDPAAPNVFGDPVDWPDPAAQWIWDRDQSGAYDPLDPGATPLAPAGDVYFRVYFTTAARTLVEARGACDDAFDAYIDGVRILTDGPVYGGTSQSTRFGLSAGDHILAVKGTNANALKAGLRFTIMEILADGSYGDVVVHSDADWICLGYPAGPPGLTPGAILLALVEEAQARGALLDLSVSFTADLDSAGDPWDVAPDVAFRVGLDGLSVVRQLTEAYVDVAMAPDELRLDAWVHGQRGATTAVALHPPTDPDDPASGNLIELVHEIS
jgi:hypothetical protein